MSQQKSRSRKRHQFWCHRRKSAPIWSLVLSTTDKIRQFWAENKLFSRKAHKNRFFVLYPLRDKKISFNPQFLAFLDGYPLREKKEIYQSGLFLILLDAYQMGEKFSKPFIKIEFSCSTTWGRKIFTAKARFLIILVAYLLREEKYIFSKGLIFNLSRDLPLEGRKLQNRHNFWPLPVGTSEEIFKTEVKKRVSRWLLFGREIFWKHPAKWLFSLGISEEKKFHQSRNFRSLSLATLWGNKTFLKTPTKTASPSRNK